jgi:hypothetical protein
MRSLRFIALLFLGAISLIADQYVASKSPDEAFALRVVREDNQPYRQSDAIIDTRSGKAVVDLDTNHPFDPDAKLLWSADSQWVAYWHHPEEGRYDSEARVFVRNSSVFEEMKFPELPTSKFSETASGAEKHSTRIKPLRWTNAGLLEVEIEVIADTGGRGAIKMSIRFDRQRPAAIVKADREPVSVVDYFLLLPKQDFEAPPLAWLDHNARVVDKENGYISISGDGAQPSFDVALFRYRDGRPLLAVCAGELEGPDSVDLKFYQLDADRKMHQAAHDILPIAEFKNVKFDLPRHGRTIVVRNLKSGKVLHRFTWNGEKFIEENR